MLANRSAGDKGGDDPGGSDIGTDTPNPGGGDTGGETTGGGNGAYNLTPATSGVTHTGSGGGGGAASFVANAGGSGIVIIRYPATQSPPASFGGANTPQVLYSDGYQIYIWTASGTVTF